MVTVILDKIAPFDPQQRRSHDDENIGLSDRHPEIDRGLEGKGRSPFVPGSFHAFWAFIHLVA
jgi:hypothetical protein